MGSCCSIELNRKITFEEFENYRETYLGLPDDDLKTTDKELIINSYQENLSVLKKILK